MFAKWVSALCILVLAIFVSSAVQARTEGPTSPSILLDGIELPFPVPPIIVNDRTMVPFRAIAEALGVQVTWHEQSRSVEATAASKAVWLTIGDRVARVNGAAVALDVPPMILNDRTLVPLRFFSEVFGAQVGWDGETRTVRIESPVRPVRMLGFYAIRSFDERHLVPRFSDMAYGWARLTPDGRVDVESGPDYRWPEPAGEISGERLLAEAAEHRTRRHLMLFAEDTKDEYTAMLLDPFRTAAAARAIAAAVAERGFDGVLIDIELLGQTEQGDDLARLRAGFVLLVERVAAELRPQGREVTVAVHPPNGSFRGYDYAALARAADALLLMAHDYRPPGAEIGPEPLALVMEAIELLLAEVPREQVLLGTVAAYETPETLAQKAALAKRYGLSGLSVWRLGAIGSERMEALSRLVIRRE